MSFSPFFGSHLSSVVTFGLALIFFSLMLRSRRQPASTMAWLFFVLVAPYIGIPLFMIFGGRKVRNSNKSKLVPTALAHPPEGNLQKNLSPLADSVCQLLRAAGSPSLCRSPTVKLFASGEEAFDHLLSAIQNAERRIEITTFILGNDPVGKALIEALAKQAAKGVEVYLIIDGLGSNKVIRPSLKPLISAGGKVRVFSPLFRFHGRLNLRNHRKLAIFDRNTGFLGGANLATEYMGPSPDPKRWIDLIVKVSGQAVQDLAGIFESDWHFSQPMGPSAAKKREDIEVPKVENALKQDSLIQVVATGPDVKEDLLYDALLASLFSARSRIWIATPYFIPDDALAKAISVAAKRGVDVKITLPRKSNHRLADWARSTYLREVYSYGAKLYFTDKMLHAKAVLIDEDVALLGSANLDLRSLLLNYELGLFLYSAVDIENVEHWFREVFSKSRKDPSVLRSLSGRPKWTAPLSATAEGLGRLLGPFL